MSVKHETKKLAELSGRDENSSGNSIESKVRGMSDLQRKARGLMGAPRGTEHELFIWMQYGEYAKGRIAAY
jgi:hypothetical protein